MRTPVTVLLVGLVVVGTLTTTHLFGRQFSEHHPYKVVKTDAEWQKILPKESFVVLRHSGTEEAFTGKYWNNHAKGTYVCAGCGQELFSSGTKFESGTGWPSFYQPLKKSAVDLFEDDSLDQVRTEVVCSRCGGHLGHVFNDGPAPTGLRFCMNSAALKFVPAAK